MNHRFIAFHTMIRGSGKPAYIVKCAKVLAERNYRVLIVDGLMYEQGAVPHQLYQVLGSAPVIEDGRNLYDLICDYEILSSYTGHLNPANVKSIAGLLKYPFCRRSQDRWFPDICARTSLLPNHNSISYLPGNNGKVVEVRERIDFSHLFEQCAGHSLFTFIRQELSGCFDYVLLNAPAGHQEISGILCGQIADLILAIDLDSPAIESNPSFEACQQLVQRVSEGGGNQIAVKSVKGHDPETIVQMMLEPSTS